MNSMQKKFGNEFKKHVGFFAKPGRSKYLHKFGGQDWRIGSSNSQCCLPSTIVVLDKKDPFLSQLKELNFEYIPLCSYINCDKWIGEQTYSFDVEMKTISFEISENEFTTTIPNSILPNPLPEVNLALVEMHEDDYPISETKYWKCCDNFVGGDKCFRILGLPLWLQEPKCVKCKCGSNKVVFLACIGYENWNGPFNYITGKPFFFGETALYFFICPSCGRVTVISQPT